MNQQVPNPTNERGATGAFTLGLASRLLAARPYKVKSWLEGSPNSHAEPILVKQLPQIAGKTVLGFLDLIESAFVRHFLALGYSPQTIRKLASRLREKHGIEHPFATKSRFRADGKKVFQEVISDTGERKLWDVMSDQFEIGKVVEPSLFEQIFYVDDIAARWTPLPAHPSVVIDPMIAFGKPVVSKFWVPTAILFKSYLADGDASVVADDYDVTEAAVFAAVKFETDLDARIIH